MSVSVGNAFGGRTGNGSMFLEGLEVAFRPTSSMLFHVPYRDVRSPLQYGLPRARRPPSDSSAYMHEKRLSRIGPAFERRAAPPASSPF